MNVKLLFFLLTFSPLSMAYQVENNTYRSQQFFGQFCAACWHGTIPEGATSGCPGNAHGCRGSTWVYMYVKMKYRDSRCFWTSNVPVTAHGRIVFNGTRTSIEVYDDQGTQIDLSRGSYYYEGFAYTLTKTNEC